MGHAVGTVPHCSSIEVERVKPQVRERPDGQVAVKRLLAYRAQVHGLLGHCRQGGRGGVGVDRAGDTLALGTFDVAGDAVTELAPYLVQDRAELGVLDRRLGRQRDHVGVAVVEVGEAAEHLHEAGADAAGAPRLGRQVDQGRGVLLDQGDQRRTLVREICVEGPVADPGAADHVLDPCLGVAQLGERPPRGDEQLGACLQSRWHPPSLSSRSRSPKATPGTGRRAAVYRAVYPRANLPIPPDQSVTSWIQSLLTGCPGKEPARWPQPGLKREGWTLSPNPSGRSAAISSGSSKASRRLSA